MSEIKVGEYIRTDEGIIGKIKRIELDKNDISLKWYVFDKKRPDINIINEVYINKPYIVNHSPNIIDLVTMEDIFKIKEGNIISYIGFTNSYAEEYADFIEQVKNKEIELLEVLTKEQFLANSYKVGE